MAGARGAYFKATNALAFDQEAQRIRAKYGSKGFDWYVTILCTLINQGDGTLDVSDEEGWAYLSSLLYESTIDEATEFCAYLAKRGLLSAGMLGDGVLCSQLVQSGIAEYDRFAKAGRASGAARRKRAAEAGEQRSERRSNNVPNSK